MSSTQSSNWCPTCGSRIRRPRRARRRSKEPRHLRLPPGSDRRTGATCAHASRRRVRSSMRLPMPADYTYDYAIVRVVPRVDRGEQVNVGIVLSCPDADYLDARIEVDE